MNKFTRVGVRLILTELIGLHNDANKSFLEKHFVCEGQMQILNQALF